MMAIDKGPLYLLPVLVLTGLICLPLPLCSDQPLIPLQNGAKNENEILFSRQAPKTAIEPDASSGRRIVVSGTPSDTQDTKQGKDEAEIDVKLNVEGVLMWDYDQFNGVHLGNAIEGYQVGNETELRRARIELESTIDKDWEAKLEVSFENDDSAPEIGDAYIAFTGWNDLTVTAGQTKEPFGLEEQTSSSCISFIERSMATSAFAPGYHPGLALSGVPGSFTWAIGVFEAADREYKRDTHALTGRLTFTPWEHQKQVLHVGISGSVRDFGGEPYAITERAEVHTAEEIIKSVETPADDVRLAGVEFAWVRGPFSLQAEHMTASIQADVGEDATYAGYYIQGSHFLTGEHRPYKNGRFKSVNPGAPYGALELVSRYSVLDAEDNERGASARNLTLGANYYINKRIRLMINYIKTTLRDGVSKEKAGADAISTRIQYEL
ncbi:MAG: OprO/OprP family phosphate-selective porin [bacterium]